MVLIMYTTKNSYAAKYMLIYVNYLYLVCELDNWSTDPSNNFTIKNVLLDTGNLTINSIRRKIISYSSGLALVGASSWSFGNELSQNVVVFGVDISSPRYPDN